MNEHASHDGGNGHGDALTPVRLLAEWLTALQWREVPGDVRTIARLALLDTVGVAVAGSGTPVAGRAAVMATAQYGAGHACLWGGGADGRAAWLTAPGAAFVNGACAHALDFDDNCYAGFVHGSAVTLPAALATAQTGNRNGADLLLAYIVGVECEFALGAALGRGLYDDGWWTTGVLGPVGACAAACRALGLEAQTTAWALGIALTGTGGMKVSFGTDAKALMVGRAAEAGVSAALLAQTGCTGPMDAIESPRGLAARFNRATLDVHPFETLGLRWRLREPGIDLKRIPLCLSAHAAVDALRALCEQGIHAADIERIVCDAPPIVLKNLAYAAPETPQEAQFSMHFAMACVLTRGDVTLADLADDVVHDPALREVMARVQLVSSHRWSAPELLTAAPEGCWVQVTRRDGRVDEAFCAMPLGSAAVPMPAALIEAKFLQCATRRWSGDRAERVLGRLRSLDAYGDTRTLFE